MLCSSCWVAPSGRPLDVALFGLWRFSWTTVVGFLPLTASVAYLGSQANSLSFGDPFVWITLAVFVALLAATRLLGPRPPSWLPRLTTSELGRTSACASDELL